MDSHSRQTLLYSLGPSGGNDYFTPNFWAGRGSETVGRRGPRISPKVSRTIRGTCGAQSSNLELQKNLPWIPPLNHSDLGLHDQESQLKLVNAFRSLNSIKVDFAKTLNLRAYSNWASL